MTTELQENECITKQTISLEARTPSGWWGRASGVDMKSLLLVVIVLLVAGGLWHETWQVSLESAKRDLVTQSLLAQIIERQLENQKVQASRQDRVLRGIEILTYVTSQNEKAKQSLNLTMPEELKGNYYGRAR